MRFRFILVLTAVLLSGADRTPDAKDPCRKAIREIGVPAEGSAISKELIELELSGFRLKLEPGKAPCLKSKIFTYVRPIQVDYPDALTRPQYILKKGRDFSISKEKWIDDGSVEVSFVYIGTQDGVDTSVTDRIVYTVNFGERRRERGCVSFLAEPQHTVMREECR